jgi:hypothetical protein
MTFEREGAPPVANPAAHRLGSELRKLKSYGHSSFAALTGADGSYVQVAGGGVGCMLEWRDTRNHLHRRAFLEVPVVPFQDETELTFGGGTIALRRDEWLNIQLVIEAFTAFSKGEAFPATIRWRDVSEIVGLP